MTNHFEKKSSSYNNYFWSWKVTNLFQLCIFHILCHTSISYLKYVIIKYILSWCFPQWPWYNLYYLLFHTCIWPWTKALSLILNFQDDTRANMEKCHAIIYNYQATRVRDILLLISFWDVILLSPWQIIDKDIIVDTFFSNGLLITSPIPGFALDVTLLWVIHSSHHISHIMLCLGWEIALRNPFPQNKSRVVIYKCII